MPHHFLCDTGDEKFYQCVDADTLLLPTCIAGLNAMIDPQSEYKDNDKYKLNRSILEGADKVYRAFDGRFKIKI